MIIFDTVTEFVQHYQPTAKYLTDYYASNKKHYEEYFHYHCHHVEEKKQGAIEKHAVIFPDLLLIRDMLQQFIPTITAQYEKMYTIHFTSDVHLLVGLYCSNAFTYRQYNPDVAFCLEKMPKQERHLNIIIGHEFGHVTHCLYSDKYGIDWDKIDWVHPITWLLQEGIATYLSTKVVQARLDEYFAFEEDPQWLEFAEANQSTIAQQFFIDLTTHDAAYLWKEWFSINGGQHFQVTRLAYYVGYCLVKQLVDELGEQRTFLLWDKENFHEMIMQTLLKMM